MAEPPRRCNAAAWFVDRHVAAARGDRTALVADGRPLAYRTVFENVNRTGHALRRLGVGMGDRVLLLLPDVPEFAYGFWGAIDRKSTRLNSSHSQISYAVFCLKKKKKTRKE